MTGMQYRPPGGQAFYSPARDITVIYPEVLAEVFRVLESKGHPEFCKEFRGQPMTVDTERLVEFFKQLVSAHELPSVADKDFAATVLEKSELFSDKYADLLPVVATQLGVSMLLAMLRMLRMTAELDQQGRIVYGAGNDWKLLKDNLGL